MLTLREWLAVGTRDPVIARAQRQLPGLRPCGFHSPYEAAAWAVLSQRMRIVQAAQLRDQLVRRHGDRGAFPSAQQLLAIDLDLSGRKSENLHAVAHAALDTEITVQYGPQATLAQVSAAWRPFRSWAAVYLRALPEQRAHEIGSPPTIEYRRTPLHRQGGRGFGRTGWTPGQLLCRRQITSDLQGSR
jgi:DNA-3-methyladenine glycosylase II